MDNSQIENTISEIRKCICTITVSNENNFPKRYGNDYKKNHAASKWDFGESDHQKTQFAGWSKNFGRFLLNKIKIQDTNLSPEPLVF